MRDRQVLVLGFFPPPITGQAVATERLASLIEERQPVQRVNLSSGAGHRTSGSVRLRPDVAFHFAMKRRRWAKELAACPEADVLWAAVSPTPLGHLRDALVVLPLLRPRQRVFGVVHQGNFETIFGRSWTARTVRRLLRRLHGFVFLTQALSHRCAPWLPPEKRWVIPNTIDAAAIASEDELRARRERLPGSTLRLLFLSNMIPEKGYADVLAAASRLYAAGRLKEAVFIGRWSNSEHQQAFETEVNRLGLTTHVRHEGAIGDRKVTRQFLLNTDVFLLPTYYPTEAQPLTILEALATGTPVVTTQQGGIPEMIDDGVEGFFTPARDPAAIAKALVQLTDPVVWQRMSHAARARFDRQFHPDIVRQRWLMLLDGTLPNA